ncbi:MAG TPA: alpha-amylase family glycosyl hydrolase [Anaerolineales bacterium]|nr:alpha-amylase family glycosyl hydrolase [Anaerolineales bacterium]
MLSNATIHRISRLLIFVLILAAGSSPALADQVNVTLDGVRDAGYVQIAADPSGDLASPGPADFPGTAWTDLTALHVAADADNLYVYVDAPAYNDVDSTGQIGLAIDVDGDASGGSTDPWANAITFAYDDVNGFPAGGAFLPDYVIRGNVSRDGGWTELRAWNGNWDAGVGVNWGGINGGHVGTRIAYSFGNGIEITIPRTDIGDPDLARVRLQFFATQGGGGKGAYDTLPSDDQSTGWDDPTTQTKLVSVPLAVDPAGDLSIPGPGEWIGVAWTDQTRLHAWDDETNLYLYLPMPAYDPAVSSGQIGLAIDTGPGGGGFDPWGNAITYAYAFNYQNLGQDPLAAAALPDFIIRGNIYSNSDNGWTEFRTWNGSDFNTGGGTDWGGIGNSGQGALPGSKVAWTSNDGLRLTIPFADINVSAGDSIGLQFFGTQGGAKGAYDTVPSDDQSNGWEDATTQLYLATYDLPAEPPPPPPPEGCQSGAALDNDIFWADLGHNSRDPLYRTPGGPVTAGTSVTLRLRSACDDLAQAKVRLWNDRTNVETILDMAKAASDSQYDWWEVQVPVSAVPTVYWYRFIAIDGSSTAYHEDDAARDGGWGETSSASSDYSWQLTMYDSAFQTPDWVKQGIMYQVFPDRFRNGDPGNDPAPGRFFYGEPGGTIYRSDPDGGTSNPWNTVVCDPRDVDDCPGTYSLNFYGGDLQGVIDQIDYLDDLGVTILYFNPIFESPSNHKYDTTDFGVISEDFGDLATFQALVAAANSRGISVVLDGVFNHTSSDSVYFDRYSRYDAAGNLTSPGGPGTNDGSGACESPSSPYRDWYYFTDVTPGTGPCAGSDGTPGGATYESWFGFDSLPKLNAANPEVRDLVFDGGPTSIALYWLAEGAKGWRFDVGGDIDPGLTNDPGNDYWESFRAEVRALHPDAYLVLEEWGNASPWLLGAEMDATMNYQYSSAMLGFWRDTTFTDNDHNPGSSAGELVPLSPSQLDARLHNWIERYPPEALYAMMNLLGSHDTNRALFMLDENAANGSDSTPLLDPNYDWSDALERLKGVVLLQMTLPGAPTIYYGDEVGLVGPAYHYGGRWEDDPYNRQPYPWLDETGTPFYTHLQSGGAGHTDLLPYYQALTAARNAHPALQTGSFDTLLVDDGAGVYAYGRLLADYSDAAIVVVNRAGASQGVTVDVAGYLPVGASFTDVLNGGSYTVNASGELVLPSVPGMSGALLVADAALAAAPDAVNDLQVTDLGSDFVDLAWSAAPGADSYDVYRSPVSGGGYAWIANTAGTSFTDPGLAVATDYFYVVVSKNDTTLLESGLSNEAAATTAYIIGWANLQWPPSIVHTISAVTSTENIYGQVWIDGVTSEPGPTPGLLAQVGFGPSTTIDESWTWSAMSFNTDAGNNDEFVGNLLPDALGTFCYTTRFSGDGGATWFYAVNGPDEGNPTCPGPFGVLTVVPGADTTAPAAPANLEVTHTTSGSISLGWDAHPDTDGDLFGFEVYRENVLSPGFSRIAVLNDPGAAAYTDEAVVADETYNYYVVAFDESFNRSAPSNTVQATAEPRLVSVTFRATVPAYTPGTVHIAGSIPEFGPWDPGLVPLTQVGPNTWEYTLDILDGTSLQYKYTRGSWETVEKEPDGNGEIADRSLLVDYGSDGTQLVAVTVQNWRDPIVVAFSPADGATGVPLTSTVTVAWNQAMPANTSFEVAGSGGPVSGSFAYDAGSQTVTFTPDGYLAVGETYTVTVTGRVDVAGDPQQVPVAWSFTTLTAEEAIQLLIEEVEALRDGGALNRGQASALLVKLKGALTKLARGQDQVAANRLTDFVHQVADFIDDGVLSEEEGGPLIDLALLVIAGLE